MARSGFIVAALVSGIVLSSPAAAQTRSPIMHAAPPIGFASYFGRYTLDRPESTILPRAQQIQVRRWQQVGQCVVDRDRQTSVFYITARRGSDAAGSAMARLKPVFDVCLEGAQIDAPGSQPLRRAAIADALGVFVSPR